MIRKLWIAVLAFMLVTAWVEISYSQPGGQGSQGGAAGGGAPGAQGGGSGGAQGGSQTGQPQAGAAGVPQAEPGSLRSQQPELQPLARLGKTAIGTVKNVDLANRTLTVQLAKEQGDKDKEAGESMSFIISDGARWESTQWKSLSDLKPGDIVEVQFTEANGRNEVQVLRVPSGATGITEGRGAGAAIGREENK